MVTEDESPRKTAEIVIGADLSMMSIEHLQERITILESEIARIRQVVDSKQQSRTDAEAFFKR